MLKRLDKLVLTFVVISLASPQSLASFDEEAPLVRGPGVSQEIVEAVAEAHGRQVLSDYLDFKRPGEELGARLSKAIERAQSNWLSGSIESARSAFREIAKLALLADWRDSQREAIHYAMLRLAQSAPTSIERDEWLERALATYPDLRPDPDAFPPPLLDAFESMKKRVLAGSILYSPYEHFPDHRLILINGKKYANAPELKIRLPKASFRITALSDLYEPMTEQLTSSQLQVFRLTVPTIAGGTCGTPTGADNVADLDKMTIVYSADCLRTRTRSGWQPRALDQAEALRTPTMGDLAQAASDPFKSSLPEERVSTNKKNWLWIGLAALAAGAVIWAHGETGE